VIGPIGTPEKVCRPTLHFFNRDLNVIEESDRHSQKHSARKCSTDGGMEIRTKPVCMNAHFSIRNNLDPDSNVTEESAPQLEKHFSHKTSTDEGRMISIKPVPMNADHSIRDNLDVDSNVTEESDPHSEKHP
jgi:hypothetical protein